MLLELLVVVVGAVAVEQSGEVKDLVTRRIIEIKVTGLGGRKVVAEGGVEGVEVGQVVLRCADVERVVANSTGR